ncbi:hypothetical protein F441_12671 [Phytophthora nicotianae CJ01A1]|uniref:Uncharacterized protein n=3 Tax=Phytophthora nicotianae TaxID=4792 RepID=V9ETD4_PHYNI|nr:hypothetical protein F443_12711 [Phytophthora nicotianae P1569]ETP11859.1 hypothetical protein F441_12671 [Phytophthora nicotianae CJ01A1]
MVEPIKGLKWKYGGEKTTDSFIAIDVDTKYQEIMGFGGGFTEAAALQVVRTTSVGVPMGSYNFAETENDMELKDFDVDVELRRDERLCTM